MHQKVKRSLAIGVVSFVILYVLCIIFGCRDGDQISIFALVLRYLYLSLPASIIIGIVYYFMKQ